MGLSIPFTAEEIAARYPDGRDQFLQIWDAAIADLEASGLDLGSDAATVRGRGRTTADDVFT
jgi:hypothetical protein